MSFDFKYTIRPLSDRTWLRSAYSRKNSQFSAKWSDTEGMLKRETDYLNAKNIVLGIDIGESDIRIDGRIRANAKAASPAVEIAFESKHGPLIYRCDAYRVGYYTERDDSWQHNARAIAKTLEALRAVDRYSAVEHGEQYTGFKALPSGVAGERSHMTKQEAFVIIADAASWDVSVVMQRPSDAVRAAKINAHPDHNDGNRAVWDLVEMASELVLPKALV
jgi:hypothetical protein